MTIFPAPSLSNAPARAVVATADDRMTRNAGSLIASSVLTSAFGFAFWILAARTMSTADVGTGTAIVAALVLLGNMSTLGLRNALPRFLPATRSSTSRIIGWSYAASAATALVVGSVFVVGARWWADELTGVRDDLGTQALFVAAVAVWAVFILQDNVLVGLRTATWVPIENLAYAVAKLGGLVAIASIGSWAVPIAWIIPALAILLPLNVGIFTMLVPDRPPIKHTLDDTPIDWRSIGRFAAGDHFADIVRLLGAEGVVLIVVAQLGPAASAPLFFAITIAASLQLVSSNVMSAFVAEAAARPAHADELLRRAAKHIIVLVVPGALIATAAAPLGLALFGSDFVESGTPVLRLLLLAAIPQIALSLAIGQARYQRRVSDVVVLAVAASLAPVIGAWFLVPTYGIVAVGWSVLIGQTVLAIILLATSLRGLLHSPREVALNGALSTRTRLRQQRRNRAGATVFDELDTSRGDAPRLWPRSVIATESDVVVAKVASEPPRVVKVALSAVASRGLQRHATSLEAMRRATEGTPARQLVPVLLELGSCMGQTYVVESACRGTGVVSADAATVGAVAGAFNALHRATARPQRPSDDVAHEIVAVPCRTLLADERLRETPARDRGAPGEPDSSVEST